jgi:hypothetical protein
MQTGLVALMHCEGPTGRDGHHSMAACRHAYADKARRLVPGWSDLQKVAAFLVAVRTSEHGSVLVVGTGAASN